mgnify:CR=1 FL=1
MKMTKQAAEKKVYELTERLIEVKKNQKDVNSGYKETIKEIESEIKAVIEDFNGDSSAPSAPPNGSGEKDE